MEKPLLPQLARPGDPMMYGSPSYKRTFAAVGYRDGARTKIGIFADNKTHARSIAKKAGYEVVAIKLVVVEGRS